MALGRGIWLLSSGGIWLVRFEVDGNRQHLRFVSQEFALLVARPTRYFHYITDRALRKYVRFNNIQAIGVQKKGMVAERLREIRGDRILFGNGVSPDSR